MINRRNNNVLGRIVEVELVYVQCIYVAQIMMIDVYVLITL